MRFETIIGLGKAGENIAKSFKEKSSSYKINIVGKEMFYLPTPENIEEQFPEGMFEALITEEAWCDEDVLVCVAGASLYAAATLRVIEVLKRNNKNVYVLYIKSDTSDLSRSEKLLQRSTYYILQEYARSGKFEGLLFVDNQKVESILGGVPIMDYYNHLNEPVVNTLHMINVLSRQKPIMGSIEEHNPVCNIWTFGTETSFFDLEFPREKQYFFAFPEEKIKTDGNLLSHVKGVVAKDELEAASFAIFSTQYEDDYVFYIERASFIQMGKEKNSLQPE